MNDYKVGQAAELETVISDESVREYARISGDNNPIHLDDSYAAASNFGQRIAHGMLVAGSISNLIGTKFPGYGTIYVSQSLKFRAPVYVEDRIRTAVEVIKVDKERKRLTLKTEVVKVKDGTNVICGEAVVIPPGWV